jgi:hypothetical protein
VRVDGEWSNIFVGDHSVSLGGKSLPPAVFAPPTVAGCEGFERPDRDEPRLLQRLLHPGHKRRHDRPDRGDPCDQLGGASGRLDAHGEIVQVDLAAARMQIEAALRELRHLGYSARDGDERDRMLAQLFDHAADETAHVDQRLTSEEAVRKLYELPEHSLSPLRKDGEGNS